MATLEQEHRQWLAERQQQRERQQRLEQEQRGDTSPGLPLRAALRRAGEAVDEWGLTWDRIFEALPESGEAVPLEEVACRLGGLRLPTKAVRDALCFALRSMARVRSYYDAQARRVVFGRRRVWRPITERTPTMTDNERREAHQHTVEESLQRTDAHKREAAEARQLAAEVQRDVLVNAIVDRVLERLQAGDTIERIAHRVRAALTEPTR